MRSCSASAVRDAVRVIAPGPLLINGEHAQGEVFVPMATTEGTLIASYNRGMRLLSECGGVKTTVVEDHMQRAPVFIFDDALQAREFGAWVEAHTEQIRGEAEATTKSGKLSYIGQYQIGPLRYLRLNYTTGDAAGQNMTGKATLAACEWIKANHPDKPRFILSGNIDTDKKHSQINMLLTRGRRVVAEAVIKNDVLQKKQISNWQLQGTADLLNFSLVGWCHFIFMDQFHIMMLRHNSKKPGSELFSMEDNPSLLACSCWTLF